MKNSQMKYSFKIENKPEKETIVFKGEPIELRINESVGSNSSCGQLLFVNDIPQKYYINMDEKLDYLHSIDVEKEGTVTLYYMPQNVKNGDSFILWIVDVIGAKYRPLGAHDAMHPGFDTKILAKYIVIAQNEVNEKNEDELVNKIGNLEPLNYTDYELSEYIKTYPDGTVENKLEKVQFRNTYIEVNETVKKAAPKLSELGAKYTKLLKVYEMICKQNDSINSVEDEVKELQMKLTEATGIFNGGKRKKIQAEIDSTEDLAKSLRKGLYAIARNNGYKNVSAFMKEFYASKAEYDAYNRAAEGANKTARKSLKSNLDSKKKESKNLESMEKNTPNKNKNKGAR